MAGSAETRQKSTSQAKKPDAAVAGKQKAESLAEKINRIALTNETILKAEALDLNEFTPFDLNASKDRTGRRTAREWGSPAFSGPFPIQDLPEDLLASCLGRVPGRQAYCALRAVCRRWRGLMASPLFFQVRCALGLPQPCLFTLGRSPEQSRGAFTGQLYDPASGASHSFSCPWPAIRERRVLPAGLAVFGCVAVGFEVFLLGGPYDTHVYSPVLNAWRTGARMRHPRRDFACGAIGGKIYVAGGLSLDNQRLRSAEAYDIHLDRWEKIADMPEMRSGCKGEVVGKKLFIVGDQTTFAPNRWSRPKMLIYDPFKDQWKLATGLPDNRWFFQTTVFEERLCVNGGGRMPYPAPPTSQPCWAAPLVYDEPRDEWLVWGEQKVAKAEGQDAKVVCTSSVCSRLRDSALSLRILSVGLGHSLCIAVSGEHKLFWCERAVASKATSCSMIWNMDGDADSSRSRGKAKIRRRLKHPWHGHINSIAVVLHL